MKLIALSITAALTLAASAEVISWDASPSPDVTGYRVYWSASLTGPFVFLGATSALSFTNTSAGRFAYYVTATNACCESDPSAIAMRPGQPNNPKVR